MRTDIAETLDVVEEAHKAREELSRLTNQERRRYFRIIKRIERLLDEDRIEEAAHILTNQSNKP